MGIPVVGKRHQRKASTAQAADRQFRTVFNRIRGTSGSGCSSANHQQPFQPQNSSSDNRDHIVGTLLSRGVADLQATPESKRLAQGKLVDAILPGGMLSAIKPTLIQ